jgi:hypothetical protein
MINEGSGIVRVLVVESAAPGFPTFYRVRVLAL